MIVEAEEVVFSKPKGFIVLEGPNGAGKSTVAQVLKKQAEDAGKKVRLTFEPGNTPIGKSIRQIVLGQNSAETKLTSLTELLLFSADRNLHVEQLIKPALESEQLVICDRYFYSTLAFQGYGRGIDLKQIEQMSELATTGLKPDVVILLDLPAEIGLQRTRTRNSEAADSFEAEEIAFHNRLRNGFLEIASNRPEPFVVLDASQDQQLVCQQAQQIMTKLLGSL